MNRNYANPHSRAIVSQQLIQVSQISKERKEQLKIELSHRPMKYLEERICDEYKAGEEVVVTEKVQQLIGLSSTSRKSIQPSPFGQNCFDTEQVKDFMNQFSNQYTQRKKSRFETLINRLKEQQKGQEFNLKDALISLIPQFDEYKRLKQKHMKQSVQVHETETHRIITRTVKKLGLQQSELKGSNWIQRLKTDANESTIQPKTQQEQLTNRIKTIEASHIALEASSQQFSNLLNTQEQLGQYKYPFQVRRLMKIKHKVKDFYDNIVEVNTIDTFSSELHLNEYFNQVKSELKTWQNELKSQNEIMEQQLVEDIKGEVIVETANLEYALRPK